MHVLNLHTHKSITWTQRTLRKQLIFISYFSLISKLTALHIFESFFFHRCSTYTCTEIGNLYKKCTYILIKQEINNSVLNLVILTTFNINPALIKCIIN